MNFLCKQVELLNASEAHLNEETQAAETRAESQNSKLSEILEKLNEAQK